MTKTVCCRQLRARHYFSSIFLHYVTHVIDAHSRRSCVSKRRTSTASCNEETWRIKYERETRITRDWREKRAASLSSPQPLSRLSNFKSVPFQRWVRMYLIGRRPLLRNPLLDLPVDSLDLLSGRQLVIREKYSVKIFRSRSTDGDRLPRKTTQNK